MQWYKFLRGSNDFILNGNEPLCNKLTAFTVIFLKNESVLITDNNIFTNRQDDDNPEKMSIIYFDSSKRGDVIYYFSSLHKEFREMVINEYKCQPCDTPDFSKISRVWGNANLNISDNRE